ncbi:MAG: hypothetical protein K2Q10_11765 [Rhodospirillales bacterium]|nr:hypothetical protein [Rhodospirillales bacterium]
MNVKRAARRTAELALISALPVSHPWFGKDHILEMATKIEVWDLSAPETERKAHRWLGWMQCAVVMGGGATLDDMARLNLECRDDHGPA